MGSTTLLISILLLLCISPHTSQAHITLKSPPPFGSRHNPYSLTRDWSLTNPLLNASFFPCKNYHTSPSHGAGHPVASWPAGSTQNFTLEGTAWHNGGSCQVSLSYDNGKRWKVVKSFIGGCPPGAPDERIEFSVGSFTVPKEAEVGEALFAWTWFNRIGNREMYMSCAAVTITKPEPEPEPEPELDYPLQEQISVSPQCSNTADLLIVQSNEGVYTKQIDASSSGYGNGLEDFPDILVAQLEGLNNCYIPEGEQVEFPHPGRNVYRGAGPAVLPRGNCEYPDLIMGT